MGREKHFKRNPWIELGFGMEYTENITEKTQNVMASWKLKKPMTKRWTEKKKQKKTTLISHDWSLKHLFPKGGQPQSPSYLMTLGQMTCWKYWGRLIIHSTLPKTNRSALKMGPLPQKEAGSSSNHQFPVAFVLLVSGRVIKGDSLHFLPKLLVFFFSAEQWLHTFEVIIYASKKSPFELSVKLWNVFVATILTIDCFSRTKWSKKHY